MEKNNLKEYDLEDVYDEKISPLMTRIIEICKEHDMPMLCTFQYANDDENGDAQCTSVIAPAEKTSSRLMKSIEAIRPKKAVSLAITEVTKNGTKKISIRNVS